MMTLRSILFIVWIYLTMAILAVVCLPFIIFSKRMAVETVRFWIKSTRMSLRVFCGIKTEIRGIENIPEGKLIWASKHQSMYDAFVPWLVLDHPAIIIKKELLWYPFFGWYAWRTDMIGIDRAGGSKTLRNMIDASRERMEAGRQLLIFPEGTRQKPGATPKYRPGVFGLYHELDVPVVPVATNIGLCWPRRGVLRRPGTVVIEVLPIIETGMAKKPFMEKLESTIEPACERLLDEGLAIQGRTRADLETD